MILEEETYKKFGYYPSDLKPQSGKKILAACDGCGKVREFGKSDYHTLCGSCAMKSCAKKGKNHPNWKGGQVKRICKECGKEFETNRPAIKKGWGKFCSTKCAGVARSKLYMGENSSNWKGGKIKRICFECGKIFFVPKNQIKKEHGKYCSRKCVNLARSKNYCGKNNPSWKGGEIERICNTCGRKFGASLARIKKGGGKYCSYSCARRARKFYTHHTKPELIFEEICKNNNLPFNSVADSKLWIGKNPSINPDFAESHGKKIVVFVNGDYWHSPLLKYNIRNTQRADVQVKICKRYKWKPIIIWETDLLRDDAEQFVLYTLKKENII
jgi:G:T-mismatch repair DNA endonuclease (very short patch repair protein)